MARTYGDPVLMQDRPHRSHAASPGHVAQRWRYWWLAVRAGLPQLWRLLGVVLLVAGGSLLAFLAFALGEPISAALILVLALLVTLAEGTYRLSVTALDAQPRRALLPPEVQRDSLDDLDGYLDSINKTMERHGFGRRQEGPNRPEGPLRDRLRLHISKGQDLVARLDDADRLTADARIALLDQWYQEAHELLREGAPAETASWFVTEDDIDVPFNARILLGLTRGLSVQQARARIRAERRIERLRQAAENVSIP